MICIRPHILLDTKYQVSILDGYLRIGKSQTNIKYFVKLSLDSIIDWVVENNILKGFKILYMNQWRYFQMNHDCIKLMKQLDVMVNYYSLSKIYTQLKFIGSGSSGKVYLVRNLLNQKLYACKCLNIDKNYNIYDDIKKEIMTLRELKHPHIVRPKRLFKASTVQYIIYEYCKGGTLKQRQNLDQISINQIMIQILKAVQFMHSKGIVHRDLKLDNILFKDDSNNIKIIDFEFATNVRDVGSYYPSCGTPGYVAPEVKNYEKPYDQKCDVYSCGIILYRLLLKQYSSNKSISEIDLEAIPLRYQIILQKMLEIDATKRISVQKALEYIEEELNNIQNNCDISLEVNFAQKPKIFQSIQK